MTTIKIANTDAVRVEPDTVPDGNYPATFGGWELTIHVGDGELKEHFMGGYVQRPGDWVIAVPADAGGGVKGMFRGRATVSGGAVTFTADER